MNKDLFGNFEFRIWAPQDFFFENRSSRGIKSLKITPNCHFYNSESAKFELSDLKNMVLDTKIISLALLDAEKLIKTFRCGRNREKSLNPGGLGHFLTF